MINVKCATFGSLQNNCYILTDIDSGISALVDCTEWSDKMEDFIKGEDIEYILLTHGHFDHIGGVPQAKEALHATIVIGKNDEKMLSSSRESLAAFSGISQEGVEPDMTVLDNDVITLGSSTISVIETPGHTKGGVCYKVDDVLFTGDTLFFCSCGRTDFPGGSFDEIEKSLKKLANLDGDYKVYTGHDRESTLDFERKNNPYMKNL